MGVLGVVLAVSLVAAFTVAGGARELAFAAAGAAAGALLAEVVEYVRRQQWLSVREENRSTVRRVIERLAFAYYRGLGVNDEAVLRQFSHDDIPGAMVSLWWWLAAEGPGLAESEDADRASSRYLYDLASPHLRDLLGSLLSQSIALDDRDVAEALQELAQSDRHWARELLFADLPTRSLDTEAWGWAGATLHAARLAFHAASASESERDAEETESERDADETSLPGRELVWLVRTDGRLEMGLPGESWHHELITRLRLKHGEIRAMGEIQNGRAEQYYDDSESDWESKAQARYAELYPHGLSS